MARIVSQTATRLMVAEENRNESSWILTRTPETAGLNTEGVGEFQPRVKPWEGGQVKFLTLKRLSGPSRKLICAEFVNTFSVPCHRQTPSVFNAAPTLFHHVGDLGRWLISRNVDPLRGDSEIGGNLRA